MDSVTFPAQLQLDVEKPKRNVFVTKRAQEQPGVTHIPVVTESSSRLLQMGVRTLQRTSVLQKQLELEQVDVTLTEERKDFSESQKILKQKREELQQRQQEAKSRADEFEKFVKENEVKLGRALKRFQMDRQQNEARDEEKTQLTTQLQQLQDRRLSLKAQVEKLKVCQDFLLKTLDKLQDNTHRRRFGSELVLPVMSRHQTLSISHQDLHQRFSSHTQQLKNSQKHLDELKQEHDTHRLMRNQLMSELNSHLERLKEKSKHLEMILHMQQGKSREQVTETRKICKTVKILAELCHLHHHGPLDAMDSFHMMDVMKDFIEERGDVEKKARRMESRI